MPMYLCSSTITPSTHWNFLPICAGRHTLLSCRFTFSYSSQKETHQEGRVCCQDWVTTVQQVAEARMLSELRCIVNLHTHTTRPGGCPKEHLQSQADPMQQEVQSDQLPSHCLMCSNYFGTTAQTCFALNALFADFADLTRSYISTS